MRFRSFLRKTRVVLNPAYWKRRRQIRSLSGLPRFSPFTTDLPGRPTRGVDAASFLFMYDEIFVREIYRFRASSRTPRIIDGGANVGLSILYFKQLYPKSEITGFEPDAEVFQVLAENMAAYGYSDVQLVPKALWKCEGSMTFMQEGADGGRVVHIDECDKKVTVSAVRLRDYLAGPIDFLKLDIEGAETEVLVDCQDLLGFVQNLFVEYHSFVDQPQTLNLILDILHKAGFRVHIHPPVTSPQPLYERHVHLGMDMQLNIFAFRS